MFGVFNGTIRPWSQMPDIWRYWIYYMLPSQYWIGGILSATMTGQPVECSPEETAQFRAPPGQSCQEYAGEFAKTMGGYLLDSSSDICQYCPYTDGDGYLQTLNIKASDKWRSMLRTLLPSPTSSEREHY